MKRGGKFVYSARSTAGNRPQFIHPVQGIHSNNSGPSSQTVKSTSSSDGAKPPLRSPRKRPRSPDLAEKTKVQKRDEYDDDDDDDDFLRFGTAAVEQYELTQREMADSNPASNAIPPVSIPIPHSTLSKEKNPITVDRTCNSVNTYQSNSNVTEVKESATSKAGVANSNSNDSSSSLQGRIKQLQEQNYSKDGEVKVLRGEKERLLGELRKKEEQMQQMQLALKAEKQATEQALTKERDSLITRLQFKDQELVVLQEKYSMAERKLKAGATASPSTFYPSASRSNSNSSSGSQQRSTSSSMSTATPLMTRMRSYSHSSAQDRKTPPPPPPEFLSTENFMPLSQLTSGGSGVTPVPIAATSSSSSSSRQQYSARSISREKRVVEKKQTRKMSLRARSTSPHSSDLKKMKKRSASDEGDIINNTTTTANSNREPLESESDSSPILVPKMCSIKERRPSTTEEESSMASPKVLSVPGRELDGTQILMLLVNRKLLELPLTKLAREVNKVPAITTTIPVSSASSSSTDTHISPQLSDSERMTGLLSLLHIEASSKHPVPFSLAHSTPTSGGKSHGGNFSTHQYFSGSSASASPFMSTPTRKPHTPLSLKPHTLARMNLAHQSRVRQSSGLLMAHKKTSLSAANTPLHRNTELAPPSSSLLSSINASSLHRSIGNLLASSEMSKLKSFSTQSITRGERKAVFYCNSALSSDTSSFQARGGNGKDCVIAILKQLGDLISNYHREQQNRSKMASTSLSSSYPYYSSDYSESMDFCMLSPKSYTSGSSMLSKSSSDFSSPSEGDQQLATKALESLETLVTYSRQVRQQVLLEPPKFMIDSRPSSSPDVHNMNLPSLNTSLEGMSSSTCAAGGGVDDDKMEGVSVAAATVRGGGGGEAVNVLSNLAEVSHKLTMWQEEETVELSDVRVLGEVVADWRDVKLSQVKQPYSSISSKVWTRHRKTHHEEEEEAASSQVNDAALTLAPVKGSGCGNLFSVLLELLLPPWKESRENTLICSKILVALAEDCHTESLYRFAPLLQKETLSICLDKDDPGLVSSVLSLLAHLVRSEVIVKILCGNGGEPCLLLTCYHCLLEPPASEGKETALRIQIQIVKVISQIALSTSGPLALFEKCRCSHELLRFLVSLLEKLVDGVYEVSQWSQRQLCLVCEVVALVYRVSINDHYFDTHRDSCEHTYTFVFNRLGDLLKSSTHTAQEAGMVSELLGYCEDSDDSQQSITEDSK